MTSKAHSSFISNKGLTLVELMVATVLILVLTISVGNVFINGQSSFNYLEGSANNIQEARHGLDQVSRDLRTATELTSASISTIIFNGDFDGNGSIEAITYTKSGSDLNRTIGTSTKVVASGIINTVDQPVFSYFNQNGATETSGIAAKMVQIRLLVDKDTTKTPSRSVELISKVQLRNLHERR